MADPSKKLPTNIPGSFFVDSTCINCDTCRQLAPTVFDEAEGYSYVAAQPQEAQAVREAMHALLACPTGSIGSSNTGNVVDARSDFPLPLAEGVYYCGFNSPKSYGGNSYFIIHKDGNWLVDSPKFLPYLVEKFKAMGGIKYIFLTHRDDVADADKYADVFKSERIIHEGDISAMKHAEVVVKGDTEFGIGDEFLVIPTPGHTRGHCVLLYKDTFLFTGDHLAWDRHRNELEAWPDVCWYDWETQKRSLRKLLNYKFEWVLTGHGQRVHLTPGELHAELEKLVASLQ